ncbi:MAG: anti-sigma factor antagonist [Dehalococcoidia bacterium]|nr:MAG: anti-sigma factor antagonist [Dehalococcoidia bacterium]
MKLINNGHGEAVITLDEELTGSSEKELLGLADIFSSKNVKTISLDFSNVDMMDNTGLNVLVKFSVHARKAHKILTAKGMPQRYLDIFQMTGLDNVYHVYAGPGKSATAKTPEIEYWARPVKKLSVTKTSPEAVNLNVHGRGTAGPIHGFGQLWEKTYTIDLSDSKLNPEQIISVLKDRFPEFQPPQNWFYPTEAGIKPGEIVLINASTPGGMVATGVMVLYAAPRSFTFITPQGHPEAGWVTFRSFEEGGCLIMQVQGLARASDPLYEAAFRIAGSNLQQQIWTFLLESLAQYTGSKSKAEFHKQCIDKSLQWSKFFNFFRNAQITSILYNLTHPVRRKAHAV